MQLAVALVVECIPKCVALPSVIGRGVSSANGTTPCTRPAPLCRRDITDRAVVAAEITPWPSSADRRMMECMSSSSACASSAVTTTTVSTLSSFCVVSSISSPSPLETQQHVIDGTSVAKGGHTRNIISTPHKPAERRPMAPPFLGSA